LSFYVWLWVFGSEPHKQFMLPYSAQSPITRQNKDFNTINDIWEEIFKIKEDKKYSIGQQLYYLIPLFANADNIITYEHSQIMNEYHYVTEYHIPLGNNLKETDAHKLSQFNIIKNEMAFALKHKAEKNGNSKS
tara:strand:+ start:800 stop:1201 length:402 start_codon:yes stop_codon:yes gene_type:complete